MLLTHKELKIYKKCTVSIKTEICVKIIRRFTLGKHPNPSSNTKKKKDYS